MELDLTHVSPEVLALNPELAVAQVTQPASKYKNAKAEVRGLRFQSGHEAAGVAGLILLEEQKQIFGLRLQVRFPLLGNNMYVADAVFCDLIDGRLQVRVVDFKGYATPEFKIKRRLFRNTYGMDISTA